MTVPSPQTQPTTSALPQPPDVADALANTSARGLISGCRAPEETQIRAPVVLQSSVSALAFIKSLPSVLFLPVL